jgi:UDP-N-acetyl-D-glucosamine dehydrogenase
MSLPSERDAEMECHDPFVPVISPTREQWARKKSVEWGHSTVASFDLRIRTNHSPVNYHELADWADCIIDTTRCDGFDLVVQVKDLGTVIDVRIS